MPLLDLTAKDLVLSTLQIVRSEPVDVRFLVTVAERVGVSGNATRVALTRLAKAGTILSDSRGRYALGSDTKGLGRYLESWRQGESRVIPWDGSWRGHLLGKAPSRAARTKTLRALSRLGFAEAHAALWVRPATLAPWMPEKAVLSELGIEATTSLLLRPTEETDWKGLWPTESLSAAYPQWEERLISETAALPDLPLDVALVQGFQTGRAAIGALAFDPLLPADWVDCPARARATSALSAFDAVARRLWAEVLSEAGHPVAFCTPEEGR